MDEMYGDGSEHRVCEECGLCEECDDCVCIDIEKARERCKVAMKDLEYVDGADNRVTLELHLQHIHAALGGEKEELYEYEEV